MQYIRFKLITQLYWISLLFMSAISCSNAITLIEVVDHVLETHPSILANKKSMDVSEYNYYQTFSQFLPEFNIKNEQNREISSNAANNRPQRVYLNARTNTFQLSQNVFSGFKDWHTNRAAMWKYMSVKESAAFNINTIVLEAIIAYIGVLQQERLLTLANENKVFFEKVLANLQKLFDTGTADKADYLLVKNNLQNANAIFIQTQKDYDSAIAKFKHFVDLSPKNLQPLKTISNRISSDVQREIELALRGNPNIQETQAKIHALEHEYKVVAGSFLPSLDMMVSKTQSANTGGLAGKSDEVKLGLTANLNLFKGGQSYISIQSKNAEKLSLDWNLEASIRNLKQEIHETWLNVANTVEKKRSIEEQILSAEQSLQSYLTLFDYNQAYLLNLLNAKKLLFTSQSENIVNNSNKLIYEHRLLLLNNSLIPVLNEVYFKVLDY